MALSLYPLLCIALATRLFTPAIVADRWEADDRIQKSQTTVYSQWHRIQSVEEYEQFLRALDAPSQRDRVAPHIIQRHLVALQPVLPDSIVRSLRVRTAIQTGTLDTLAADAGETLLAWWRRQDPFPATSHNERLHEHVERTRHAYANFSREDDPNDLDDRGSIYIRFGLPKHRADIDVSRKKGVFWVYSSFHDAAEYLFVRERGEGYYIGTPVDLVPKRERTGLGPTSRGRRKSIRALRALREIYGTLAHYRSRYGPTYSDLSMYSQRVSEAQSGVPTQLNMRPHSFLMQTIGKIEMEEHRANERRRRLIPTSKSEVGSDLQPLSAGVRFIRTLKENGQTQVTLYWSVNASDLYSVDELRQTESETRQSNGIYALSCSLIEMEKKYTQNSIHIDQSLLQLPKYPNLNQRVPTQQISFTLRESTRHLALQIDAYQALVDSVRQVVRPNKRIKVGTYRLDEFESLDNRKEILEMSDLQPIVSEPFSFSTDTSQEKPVYPFRSLSKNDTLAVAFEVYHLETNSKGRTDYSISYDVWRRTQRTGVSRWVRGNHQKKTTVKNRVKGENKSTSEVVWIDVPSWRTEESQEMKIRVYVKDHESRQSVSRSIKFRLYKE